MRVRFTGPEPQRMSTGASGYDIALSEDLVIDGPPGLLYMGRTGLRLQIPDGFDCQVRPRSSLYRDWGCIIPNAPGTIDSDYRGEIRIPLVRLVQGRIVIPARTRLAQLVFMELPYTVLEPRDLEETARGEDGFGSTGKGE
jgi:dUTP pyrophosphatase